MADVVKGIAWKQAGFTVEELRDHLTYLINAEGRAETKVIDIMDHRVTHIFVVRKAGGNTKIRLQ